jgi:hypothetical protein
MSMPSSNWSESLIPLLRRNKYFNSETSQLAVDTMHGGFSQMPYGLIMFQTKLGIPRGWTGLDLLKDRRYNNPAKPGRPGRSTRDLNDPGETQCFFSFSNVGFETH